MSRAFLDMSAAELQFLRMYTLTLKRQYAVFISALSMMQSTALDLKCPAEAARVARAFYAAHTGFEQSIAAIAKKHKIQPKPDKNEQPTTEELMRIIQISFFKLVEPPHDLKPPEDLGWFSGHPLEWEKAWSIAHKLDLSEPSATASPLIQALTNLFGVNYSAKFKNQSDEPYEEPDAEDDYYDDDNEYGDY